MPTRINVRADSPSSPFEEINLTVTATAQVPQELAQQCLMSMPFDSARAITFLNQVRKTLEFQSTLDLLKSTFLAAFHIVTD